MKHEKTIFDGVITNENSFTELFKNFLRFKQFRQAFLDLIDLRFDRNNIDIDSFDTQYTISKFGRPDLVLITDDTEILFEIKVSNTVLTKNQPTSYYNYLKTKSKIRNKALILIIPEYYYDTKNYNSTLEKIKSDNDEIHTQTISWEAVARIITDNELEIISPLFNEYSNLINRWFQLKSIYLDSLNVVTMFDKKFPESLEKTMLIIDNVYYEFEKQGFPIKRTKEKDWAEYGFYFNMPSAESVFFGIWFDYWKNTGNPVCICLDSIDDEQIKAFHSGVIRNNLSPAKEHEDCLTTFINEQILMDEKCETTIFKIIADIITGVQLLEMINK